MNADVSSDTSTRHDQHGRWSQAESVDDFRHKLTAVHARIAAACRRVGRNLSGVHLLPVSKPYPEALPSQSGWEIWSRFFTATKEGTVPVDVEHARLSHACPAVAGRSLAFPAWSNNVAARRGSPPAGSDCASDRAESAAVRVHRGGPGPRGTQPASSATMISASASA